MLPFEVPNEARRYANRYGLAALNTATKYPSILTLHQLGERGRLLPELTTPAAAETVLFGSEKIDGTNARILVFSDGSYLIGGRDTFLHLGGDLLFDPNNNIVKGLTENWLPFEHTSSLSLVDKARVGHLCAYLKHLNRETIVPTTLMPLTVLYGEVYGGRLNDHKQYGTDAFGFRLFDVCVYESAWALDELLRMPLDKLSLWRESTDPNGGLRYGQPFLNREQLHGYAQDLGLELVPEVVTIAGDVEWMNHESVLDFLQDTLPHSLATLHESALGKPEGIVLASADRRVRVKIRYEDYERTLRVNTPKK